jgi:O-antigen/teichoic acid export membrane protein
MAFFGPISPPLLDETTVPLIRRAWDRAIAVSRFASVQAIVQVIGFLSGILIIRHLDQRDYAYFTIANTMQGTLNLLADMGISIGLVSIGGRVWQDRQRFGELVNTALAMRRKLGAAAVLVVTPILYYLLAKNGASAGYATLLIALIIVGLLAQLALGVLGVVPRLRSDLGRIQLIDFTGAIARLGALVVLLFLVLNAAVAVAVASAVLLLQLVMLRRYVVAVIDTSAPQNAEDRSAMHGFIRNQAANAVFYCVQGQITVVLISIFAHRVAAVAEVGALGRLAMIFAVLTNLLMNIFAPAFARAQSPRRLRWQFAGTLAAVAAFCAAIMTAAAIFPREFLFVLGGKYAHLQRELLLMIGAAVINALTATLWSLNTAKAWVAGAWLYIPLTIATQVCLIPFIDFSSVRGVLVFNLVSAVPNLLLNAALSFRGFAMLRPASV